MTHEEFILHRQAGTVRAGIDPSKALRLVEHLPKRYRVAHLFWAWMWILTIPGFICVAIFWKWWAGLLLLLLVTPIIFKAIKASAAQFVLKHAEENKQFFDLLMENDLLFFKLAAPNAEADYDREH